jgi:PAS domain S-box-containing protein
MTEGEPPSWGRKYLVAALCVLAAALFRALLAPLVGATDSPLLFFAFAIAAASQYGGAPAGLFATGLGLLTSAYIFFEPFYQLPNPNPHDLALLGLFGGTGVFISLLGERFQQARRGRLVAERGEAAHRELAEQLRLSQARLEEDRRLLQAVMEYIPQGLAVVGADGTIRMDSRHGSEMLGLGGSEAGRTVQELAQALRLFRADGVTPFPSSELPSLLALEGGVVRDGELVLERPNGEKRWLMLNAGPILGEDGAIAGSVVGWRDVTDYRRHQEALRESEDRLRLAIDSTELGAFDYNPQTGRTVWSEYARLHLGLPPEEQAAYDTFLRALHPDDRERVERIVREAMRPESGGHYAADYRTVGLRDGVERWVSGRGRVYFEGGRAVRFIGVTLDITARKRMEERLRESEERYRRLFEANVVGIVTANDERVLEANGLFLNMVGYTSEDLAQGRIRCREMTPPEHWQATDRAAAEMLDTSACSPFEKEYFRKDGSRIPVLLGGVLLERTPLRCLFFILDLTERKRLERRILEAQKLESAGLLAAGIAHDFNNLLVSIIGNASLAKELLPPGDPLDELLDRIVASGDQAATLTSQMLAYAGKGRFIVGPVNLSDVVPRTLKLLEPSLPGQIALRLDLDPELPSIEADRGQIEQVVVSLVLNAAEAIGDRGGEITVRTAVRGVDREYARNELESQDLLPGKYVCLEVSDTGIGMDAETRARIFEPFFSTKFIGRGSGSPPSPASCASRTAPSRCAARPGGEAASPFCFPRVYSENHETQFSETDRRRRCGRGRFRAGPSAPARVARRAGGGRRGRRRAPGYPGDSGRHRRLRAGGRRDGAVPRRAVPLRHPGDAQPGHPAPGGGGGAAGKREAGGLPRNVAKIALIYR